MRKLFVIALIALFMAGSAYASLEGPGVGDILGQGKYPYDAHKIFRLVHISPNDNDTDGVTADSVVVWDDELDDGVSVELTTTSGDGRVAGILVTTVISNDTVGTAVRTASDDIGTSNWGWIQTYGLYDGVCAGSQAITVGKSVCAADKNGTVGEFGFHLSTSGNSGILGSCLDAFTAMKDDGIIFITCD